MADLPNPVSNTEVYLAYLAGKSVNKLPLPVTREEEYLYYLCLNGGGGGGGGTTDYNMLNNKPSINGVVLEDNKTSADLGLENIYEKDITAKSNTWNIQHNLETPWYKLTIKIIDGDRNTTYGDIVVDKCTNNLC